jgi:hypothetical protein
MVVVLLSPAALVLHLLLLQAALPAAVDGGEPLPEGLLWLLLTGEVRGALQDKQPQLAGTTCIEIAMEVASCAEHL